MPLCKLQFIVGNIGKCNGCYHPPVLRSINQVQVQRMLSPPTPPPHVSHSKKRTNCHGSLMTPVAQTYIHNITLHYITLHYITLHYITLHHITSHHITLHYITIHYITLHYITLHYITLHYITIHYHTLP